MIFKSFKEEKQNKKKWERETERKEKKNRIT